VFQKQHPYTGNINSEMPGNSRKASLYPGDVSSVAYCVRQYVKWHTIVGQFINQFRFPSLGLIRGFADNGENVESQPSSSSHALQRGCKRS